MTCSASVMLAMSAVGRGGAPRTIIREALHRVPSVHRSGLLYLVLNRTQAIRLRTLAFYWYHMHRYESTSAWIS